MQPIKLRLRGFTSFKTQQEIDFKQLDSLFVIAGPHGAGKSSILDAMSFALFGKVPRGLTAKDLLSQGSDRLSISFEFEVAGDCYRVLRDYDYKTKTPKTLVTLEVCQEGDRWKSVGPDKIKEIDDKIADLIGIDAETFFKIVLLPQGEFAKFLNGTPGDRKAILEKLFPEFGIFKRMADLAKQRVDSLTQQRTWVASQFDRLQAPTPEELSALAAGRDRLAAELTAAEEVRDLALAELTAARELASKAQDLAQQQNALEQLRARDPEIQRQRAALEAARRATALEADWRQTDDARRRATETAKRAESAVRAWETARSSGVAGRERLEAALAEEAKLVARETALTAAIEPARERARAATAWQQAHAIWQERQATLTEANTTHDRALATVDTLAAQQTTARAEMERYAPGGERLETLRDVTRHLLPQWETLQADLTASKENCYRAEAVLTDSDRAWDAARAEEDTAQAAFNSAATAVEDARNHEAAALLRSSLHAGDACPVCNNKVGDLGGEQLSLLGPDLANLTQQLQTCQTRCDDARTAANRTEIARTQARERHHQAQTERDRLQARRDDLAAQIASQLSADAWDAAAIAAEYQQRQQQDEAHRQASDAYTRIETAYKEAHTAWQLQQQQRAQALREADRAREDLQQTITDRDRAVAALQVALEPLRQDLGDVPFAELQAEIAADRERCDRQLLSLRETVERDREAEIRTEAAVTAAKQDCEAAAKVLTERETAWTAALANSNWDEAQFLSALLPYDRCQELATTLETHERQRTECERRIADLKAEIGDRALDPAALDALSERLEACRSNCADLNQQRQEVLLKLETGQRDLEQAGELATQKQDIDKQLDLAETLKKELGGRNFQRYLQDALQGDLLANASDKLQDLSDRYRLATDGSGSYLVEDNWNGGERRKVSSLSGGETFMASLAMALALGDLLARGNQIGSLFLDEGFGSLDSEAIETAISTLENLRKSDRLIGIITHVKAVSDRIPSQIQIVKSEQGSTANLA